MPGRVLAIAFEPDALYGEVEFDGVARRVCLDLLPDVRVGDYVLVFLGFARARLEAEEAQRVLELLAELGEEPAGSGGEA
jgi:hydrogenase expression/formation protein HypC